MRADMKKRPMNLDRAGCEMYSAGAGEVADPCLFLSTIRGATART